ncbi:Thioredoxin reductase [Pseudomonas sp. R5-89-07]|nr:Thioredoxin reductase [Pseudomonas sp. R5-89-07]
MSPTAAERQGLGFGPLMASVTLATSHGATAGIFAQQSMLV